MTGFNRCLAFDYGLASSGVAVGHVATGAAHGLSALVMRKGEPAWSEIEKLINVWAPDVLLVGKPLKKDGKQQAMTTKSKQFCIKLEAKFGIAVIEVDERFSTVEARAEIFSKKGARGLLKADIDVQSAVIICKQWMVEVGV